jgi:hypothetical protein
LHALTLQSLQESILRLGDLSMDGMSHKLCLVKRQNINDVGSMPYVTHITDHIRSRMAIRMRDLGSLQQVSLYRTFACTPSRGAAGHIFESFCQQNFQKRILIDYVPMVRLTGLDGKRKRQWHTSHHPIDDRNLETLRQNALGRMVTLDIYPSNICEYNDQEVQGLTPTPDVYYIPSTQNAVAVDSFIYHGELLYLFQFTVAAEHKINSKFSSRFECANFPPQSTWRFIFILPDDVKVLTCPCSRTELQALELFSSKVKMEDYLEATRFREQDEKKEEYPNKKRIRTRAQARAEGLVAENDGEGSKLQSEKAKGVKVSPASNKRRH